MKGTIKTQIGMEREGEFVTKRLLQRVRTNGGGGGGQEEGDPTTKRFVGQANIITKKNADKSFRTTMGFNWRRTTFNNKLNYRNTLLRRSNNSTEHDYKNADKCTTSSACPHCFSEKGERKEWRVRRKDKSEEEEENDWRFGKAAAAVTLFNSRGGIGHSRDFLSFLAVRQIVILSLFAFLALLTLCSAQKFVFDKSHKNPLLHQTSIVIPHIKYGQGLNRWSFLSVDRANHGLHSDLLCPTPMMTTSSLGFMGYKNRAGGGGSGSSGITARVNPGRGGNKQQPPPPPYQQQPQYPQSRFPGGQIGSASSSSSQHHPTPLPNEIWAVKTDEQSSLLPCSLRQYAVPPPFSPPAGGAASGNNGMILMNRGGGGGGGGGRGGSGSHNNNNNGHFIENRILYVNVSLVPFNFHGAVPCSKYIKLMYDEEEGTNLRCGDIPFDPQHDNKYHINWPPLRSKRKEYFSLLDNLETFLRNEQTLHRQFYFQIYFTSQINGRSKRCTVQQYELDLSFPTGNARFCNLTSNGNGGGHEELCGEFHCEDLIFPLYADPQLPHMGHHDAAGGGGAHGKHRSGSGGRHRGINSMEDDIYGDEEDYDDDEESDISAEDNDNIHKNNKGGGAGSSSLGQTHQGRDQQQDQQGQQTFSWTRMIRMDMRLLIFFTVVPLVLFGVLVFGLELIVYFMCCRKRRDEDDEGGGTRSQQLLENSLNVWENVPSRMDAQRTVSFSPMTTSIYGDRKNNHLQMMDAASLESHPETPKILKSALKAAKPGSRDDGSPTTAAHHYFDYHDHDMPPSYIETTTR